MAKEPLKTKRASLRLSTAIFLMLVSSIDLGFGVYACREPFLRKLPDFRLAVLGSLVGIWVIHTIQIFDWLEDWKLRWRNGILWVAVSCFGVAMTLGFAGDVMHEGASSMFVLPSAMVVFVASILCGIVFLAPIEIIRKSCVRYCGSSVKERVKQAPP